MFTLLVSEKGPQISLVLPIYYELHDLLLDVAERKDDFTDLAEDIAGSVEGSIKKHMKYYTFVDASDLYYTALVLDLRVKGALLLNELGEENAGMNILQTLCDDLHCRYTGTTDPLGTAEQLEPSHKKQIVGSRMLQRLRPQDNPQFSELDRYFDSARAEVSDLEYQNWLCGWWKVHKIEYLRMAAAVRYYLANPVSEVSVERLLEQTEICLVYDDSL